jgi:diphthamide synthase subunit DPH2
MATGAVDVKAVEIRAELRQIKTMADFTTNITLNVPEDCREQIKTILDWLGDEVGVVMVSGDVQIDGKDIADGSTGRTRKNKKG